MHKPARFKACWSCLRRSVVQLPLPRDCRALQWQHRPLNSVAAAAAVAVGVATTHTHSLAAAAATAASERTAAGAALPLRITRTLTYKEEWREKEREREGHCTQDSFANSSPVIIVIIIIVNAIPFHPIVPFSLVRCLLLERNTRGRLFIQRGRERGMFLPKGSFPSPSVPPAPLLPCL